MSGRLTEELWSAITGSYDAIIVHPFITRLADGSLPQESFAFYVLQDALYLQDYARALAAVASRAPGPAGIEMSSRRQLFRTTSRYERMFRDMACRRESWPA